MVSTRGIKLETPTSRRARSTANDDNGARTSRRERGTPARFRADSVTGDQKKATRSPKRRTGSVKPEVKTVPSAGRKRKASSIVEQQSTKHTSKRIRTAPKSKKDANAKSQRKTETLSSPGKEILVKFRINQKVMQKRKATLHFPLLSCHTIDHRKNNTVKKNVKTNATVKKEAKNGKEMQVSIRADDKVAKKKCVASLPIKKKSKKTQHKQSTISIRIGDKVSKKKCVASLPLRVTSHKVNATKPKSMEVKVSIRADDKVAKKKCVATLPLRVTSNKVNATKPKSMEVKVSIRADNKVAKKKCVAHLPIAAADNNHVKAKADGEKSKSRCKYDGCNKYRQGHTGGYCCKHKYFGIGGDMLLNHVKSPHDGGGNAEDIIKGKDEPKQTEIKVLIRADNKVSQQKCVASIPTATAVDYGYTKVKGDSHDENELYVADSATRRTNTVSNYTVKKQSIFESDFVSNNIPADLVEKQLTPHKYCKVPSCPRYRRARLNGYCFTHKELGVDFVPPPRKAMHEISEHALCKFVGCTRYRRARLNGYCFTHKACGVAAYDADDILFAISSAAGAEGDESGRPVFKHKKAKSSRAESSKEYKIAPAKHRCKYDGCDRYRQSHTGGYCCKHKQFGTGRDKPISGTGMGLPPLPGGLPPLPGGGFPNFDGTVENFLAPGAIHDSALSANNFATNAVYHSLPTRGICSSVPVATNNDEGTRKHRLEKFNTHDSAGKVSHCATESGDFDGDELQASASNSPLLQTQKLSSSRDLPPILPPGIEIECPSKCKDNKKRTLCKVVGCKKLDQSGNKGFCRSHYNLIYAGYEFDDGEPWTCECGSRVGGKQKRCGECFRWKGGKRDTYAMVGKKGEKTESKLFVNANGEEVKVEYWMCECGNEVDEIKSRCGICHHWRGGKRDGGWKLGEKMSLTNYECEVDDIDRSTDWECCGVSIPARKTRCGLCRGWRGGKRLVRWTYDGSEGRGDDAFEEEGSDANHSTFWECAKCSNLNLGKKKRCAKCACWRFPRTKVSISINDFNDEEKVVDGGHWICKACSYDNFATEIKCLMCQKYRPNWKKYAKSLPSDSTSDFGSLPVTNSSLDANKSTSQESTKKIGTGTKHSYGAKIASNDTDIKVNGLTITGTTTTTVPTPSEPSNNSHLENVTKQNISNNSISYDSMKSQSKNTNGNVNGDSDMSRYASQDSILPSYRNEQQMNAMTFGDTSVSSHSHSFLGNAANTGGTDYLDGYGGFDYGKSYLQSDFLNTATSTGLPECNLGNHISTGADNEENNVTENIAHV